MDINYVESKEVLKTLSIEKLQEVFDECCSHSESCIDCKNRPSREHTCIFKLKGYKRPDEFDSLSDWLENLSITKNSITEFSSSNKIFEDENSDNLVEGMIIKHSVNGKYYKVVKAQKEFQCDNCAFSMLHENLKCTINCCDNFIFKAIKEEKEMNTKYTKLITDPISAGDVVVLNENCYLVRRDKSTEIELTTMSDDIRTLRESHALDHLNEYGFRLYRIPNENNLTNFSTESDTYSIDVGINEENSDITLTKFEVNGSAQVNSSDIITKDDLYKVLNAPTLKPMDPFS